MTVGHDDTDQLLGPNWDEGMRGCGEKEHDSEVTGHDLEDRKEKGLKGRLI